MFKLLGILTVISIVIYLLIGVENSMLGFIVFIGFIGLVIVWLISAYNSMVSLRNRREQAFADIDVQLRQRNDLIPQLVETVKGYASHEKDTLDRVIQARNSVQIAHSIPDKIAADNLLTQALSGLRVTVEAYPDLKANQNFLQLQNEVSDIENKLASARRFFNGATTEYNNSVEVFPNNIIAKRYGFVKETLYNIGSDRRSQFDEQPPQIKF